ncbi:MAG TPA: hypothetical protein VKO83_14555 [Steroidobacteraceae bacterium]|nr:hypothetical protein [Steroidobacteraceae bacterium]
MKNNNAPIGAAVAALLALPSLAIAADSHRCSGIDDDARRLACYDSAFGRPARPAAGPAPAPVAVQRPSATPAQTPAAVAPATPPQPAARAKDEPVSGRIVAVGRLANDRFAVTLDNGQLWMQLERDVTAEVRVGDTVSIRPAMLGSWMLETRGGVKTRVKLAR